MHLLSLFKNNKKKDIAAVCREPPRAAALSPDPLVLLCPFGNLPTFCQHLRKDFIQTPATAWAALVPASCWRAVGVTWQGQRLLSAGTGHQEVLT